MHSLSEQDILHTWERGLRQHPVERALTILAQADPQCSRDDVQGMSVGQRDARLIAVRESLSGSRFEGYAECPRCREPLEFTFGTDDIRSAAQAGEYEGQAFSFRYEDFAMQARLPNSADLLAIADCRDVATARTLLLERCIEHVAHQQMEIGVRELPESAITALGEAMRARDPQAEIRLELACPACDYRWFAVFDILAFLWQEIAAHTKHILRDVHLLASAYGWSEAEILSLSAIRRRLYLEMVSS